MSDDFSYDARYDESGDYFGAEAEDLLLQYLDKIDRFPCLLDIGAGQGRNALFLAREGYRVHALEPSRVGCEQMQAAAEGAKLTLKTIQQGFAEYEPGETKYGAILAFGLMPVLSFPDMELLRRKLSDWIAPEGLLFITAFTIADPSFSRIAGQWRPLCPNSYLGDRGEVRSFLQSGQLVKIFTGYKLVHYDEARGSLHEHGGGKPHRHAQARGVFQNSN